MNKQKPAPLVRRATEMTRRALCGIIESSRHHHCPLEVGDVVIVTLCDTTLAEWTRIDFPHIPQRCIISNIKMDDCDCFPIPFTIYYNPEEIDENLCYGIRCDVMNKSKEIKYSSDRYIAVLTDGCPKTNISVVIEPRKVQYGSM